MKKPNEKPPRTITLKVAVIGILLATALGLAAHGCGSVTDVEMAAAYGRGSGDEFPDSVTGMTVDDGSTADVDIQPGMEVVSTFKRQGAGVDTGYVYIINPLNDSVAKISGANYSIVSIPVERNPISINACGSAACEYTNPVVLSEADELEPPVATVIDIETDETTQYELRAGHNALAVSPVGTVVAAWYDSERERLGSQTANTLQLIYPATGNSDKRFVGDGVTGLQFAQQSGRLVFAGENDLWVVDPGADAPQMDIFAVNFRGTTTGLGQPESLLVNADGSRVFMKTDGSSSLFVFELGADTDSSSVTTFAPGGNPGDMRLSADGQKLLLVTQSAGSSTIEALSVDDLSVLGSVSDSTPWNRLAIAPDSQTLLAYSVAEGDQRISMVSITDYTVLSSTQLLRPISSAVFAPAGQAALVFHKGASVDDTVPDADDHYLVSLVQRNGAGMIANPVSFDTAPGRYVFSDDGLFAFITEPEGAALRVLDMTTLVDFDIGLDSPPAFLGIFPLSHKGFVSQEHHLGRISFVDADTLERVSVTGFELNAAIGERASHNGGN